MNDTAKIHLLSYAVALVALIGTLYLGLLPALLGGCIVYFIVEFGTRLLSNVGIIPATGKIILIALITLVLGAGATAGIVASISYISEGPDSFVVLLRRMADIVEVGRDYMPIWAQQYVPDNIDEVQTAASNWLRDNALNFSSVGANVGLVIVHIVIGMIIGGMIAIRPAFETINGPLADGLDQRITIFSNAFRRVVFSQIRISALNTFLTGVFLVLILPLLGYALPFTKTMIAVTFIAGLLPIVGNLISNTVIFLIALSVSPIAAVGSLAFLVIIHKLEYFFNAHIIGTQIKARAWELLLAMLVMESIFGIAGLIAAPIYYAYLKDELTERRLI